MTIIIAAVLILALVTTAVGLLIRNNRNLRTENKNLRDRLAVTRGDARNAYLLACTNSATEIANLRMKLFLAEEKNASLRFTIQKKDMLLRQKWENAAK